MRAWNFDVKPVHTEGTHTFSLEMRRPGEAPEILISLDRGGLLPPAMEVTVGLISMNDCAGQKDTVKVFIKVYDGSTTRVGIPDPENKLKNIAL